MSLKKVLFVGSFIEKAKDGSVGGQMYACRSLISSSLSEEFNWILLDTTGKSVPPPPLYHRLFSAIIRTLKFLYLLVFRRPDSVLIFSANGPSVYEKGFMIILAKLVGAKTVFAPRGGPLINEIAASKAKRTFFKLIAKSSDYIICQGDFWKVYFSSLLEAHNGKKLVVIPNWIDYHAYQGFDNLVVDKSKDQVSILYMGWMQIEKGIHDLFDALMKIDVSSIKVNVYFLGDGSQKQVLEDRVRKECKSSNMQFSFPGWVYGSRKLAFLQSADIFVLPSYAEGMPNSLMEAMASGIACISTNVGAVPDLIDDQVNGIMYNPKDVDALASAINRLVINRELRKALASNAKSRIYENHSLDSAVDSFKRIL